MTIFEHNEPKFKRCYTDSSRANLTHLADSVKLGNAKKRMFIADETQRIFEAIALKTDRAIEQRSERRTKRG
jgi:hypothetical protein